MEFPPMFLRTLACFTAGLLLSPFANAAIINLTPSDIHGDDTTTASFTDGNLTLTPFVRDASGTPVQNTFNAISARLGIDGNGTNNGSFADADTIVGNAGDELLTFEFSANSGLNSISYDFSRADGPGANDGVVISGFLADPGVTFSVSDPNLFAVYDASAGSVRLNLPGTLFNGNVEVISFTPGTSAGQTLTLTVNDTTQAGGQFAIAGISYDNDTVAIPEPSSVAALCAVGAAVVTRRRKRNA